MKASEIKQVLRNGPYAWPGGYPLYFITTEGEALSFAAVKANWRRVVASCFDWRGADSSWAIVAVDTNWEDANLYCAETNERIPSAYAEEA